MRAKRDVRLRRGAFADLGWVLERHAALYPKEFGYLPVFVAYVAESFGTYIRHHDPALDRLWVAEQDGKPCGCIAIQHDKDRPGWAKLRWFLVDPAARGTGLGRRLLQAALRFTAQAGYRGVHLWTVDDLPAARRLYEEAGFTLAQQTEGCPWAPWGHEQRWELALPQRRASRAARATSAIAQRVAAKPPKA